MTGLVAAVDVRRDAFHLDVALEVEPGRVLAVLGENGAGKSTLVGALAGAVPLTAGRVELDGVVLEEPGSGVRVDLARRPIGWAMQDSLLFPHLSAARNVAYPLRAAGLSRADALRRAREELARLGVEQLADAAPRRLSGGQAQRVALARALARRPRLLLLDEPFAAADVAARAALRADLAARLADTDACTVLVTHDALDAEALADDVLVLEAGRVLQRGTPDALRAAPASDWVARMFPHRP